MVYPLDVMRRRLQLGGSAAGAQGGIVADSTWLALRSVVNSEGPRALFRGIVPSLVKTIPAVGISAAVCGRMNATLAAADRNDDDV